MSESAGQGQQLPELDLPATLPEGLSAETYRQAVVDLLGVIAYGELTAFERIATDSRMAPTISAKTALAGMAAAEFAHYRDVEAHLLSLGADPVEAMEPFVVALDAFHDQTAPADWLEGLVKAYVGDGIARDFYREVAAFVGERTQALVLAVLSDTGHAEFVVDTVRAAIAAEPTLAGRLALWARRLVGEALTQAQRVAVDRDALSHLIGGAADLAEVARLLGRITDGHAARISALGLSG